MKSVSLALVVLGCLSACRSSDAGAAAAPDSQPIECVCGDSDAALLGCHHPACADESGNPDNPDCVCGGLAVQADTHLTPVSSGNSMISRAIGTPQTIYLTSGRKLRGTLIADDGQTIKLRGADGTDRDIAYDDLDSRTVYRLLKARHPYEDGPGQIEVANYARDVGYYAHARRHYEAAVKADPALQAAVESGLALLRQKAAQEELDRANTAFRSGDTNTAEEHLANVLREFPGEEAAGSAAAMLGEIRAREASTTRSVPDRRAEYADLLAPTTKLLERSIEGNRDGLLASKSFSKSTKLYQKAAVDGEKARKSLAKIRSKHEGDVGLLQVADALDKEMIGAVVDANLNLASAYMTRGSHKNALSAVNQALAVDPKNQMALSMRGRIELTANQGLWGGWVISR